MRIETSGRFGRLIQALKREKGVHRVRLWVEDGEEVTESLIPVAAGFLPSFSTTLIVYQPTDEICGHLADLGLSVEAKPGREEIDLPRDEVESVLRRLTVYPIGVRYRSVSDEVTAVFSLYDDNVLFESMDLTEDELAETIRAAAEPLDLAHELKGPSNAA